MSANELFAWGDMVELEEEEFIKKGAVTMIHVDSETGLTKINGDGKTIILEAGAAIGLSMAKLYDHVLIEADRDKEEADRIFDLMIDAVLMGLKDVIKDTIEEVRRHEDEEEKADEECNREEIQTRVTQFRKGRRSNR